MGEQPSVDRWPRDRAQILRAGALCTFAGALLSLRPCVGGSLSDALRAKGLRAVDGSVRWLDPPGFGTRRALLLAGRPAERADVFLAVARTTDVGTLLSEPELYNLSRSPGAEEEGLAVSGTHAAFLTRTNDGVVAFTVVGLDGAEAPGRSWGQRLRAMVHRYQQTGTLRGYRFDRFEFVRPVPAARLALQGSDLRVQAGSEQITVDLASRRAPAGSLRVRARPRHEAAADNWITWAVDTVRAVPWIGSEPIAWAESVVFRGRRAVARASALRPDAAPSRDEDLEDLLAHTAPSRSEAPVRGWSPAPIRGAFARGEPHEGEWAPVSGDRDPFVGADPGAPPAMHLSFVRPDRERPDARAYILAWDPRQLELHVAPGSQEPMGATGETGTGVVPRDERTLLRLVGGFNGAFQGLHGEYGVYAEGTLLLPPKPFAATVAVMADGATAFGSWPPDQREVPNDVVEFRQNLSPLIDGGVFNPWRRDDWGAVLQTGDADLGTARSGLCRTRDGHVAYFWGSDLTPRALGDAMIAAGCDYGVHLDMNGPNTGFDLYRVARTGELPPLGRPLRDGVEAEGTVEDFAALAFRARRLVRAMRHPAGRYVHRNPRDFFYLLRRAVLPGDPLRPAIEPALPGEGAWQAVGAEAVAFPWPMARTRLRPDPARPDRWVNLLRIDPRRVALVSAGAPGAVVARIAGARRAEGAEARIALAEGSAGRAWSLGAVGEGVAGVPLQPGEAPSRGACVDANGFLVFAVADRAQPDLLARAFDRAGCGDARIALERGSFVLPSGTTAAGDVPPPDPSPAFSLVASDLPGARAIFTQVTPVPRAIWQPLQTRRVRYFPNPASRVTVRVRLSGERSLTLRLHGVGAQYFNNPAARAAAAQLPPEAPIDPGPAARTGGGEDTADATPASRPRRHRHRHRHRHAEGAAAPQSRHHHHHHRSRSGEDGSHHRRHRRSHHR